MIIAGLLTAVLLYVVGTILDKHEHAQRRRRNDEYMEVLRKKWGLRK